MLGHIYIGFIIGFAAGAFFVAWLLRPKDYEPIAVADDFPRGVVPPFIQSSRFGKIIPDVSFVLMPAWRCKLIVQD